MAYTFRSSKARLGPRQGECHDSTVSLRIKTPFISPLCSVWIHIYLKSNFLCDYTDQGCILSCLHAVGQIWPSFRYEKCSFLQIHEADLGYSSHVTMARPFADRLRPEAQKWSLWSACMNHDPSTEVYSFLPGIVAA